MSPFSATRCNAVHPRKSLVAIEAWFIMSRPPHGALSSRRHAGPSFDSNRSCDRGLVHPLHEQHDHLLPAVLRRAMQRRRLSIGRSDRGLVHPVPDQHNHALKPSPRRPMQRRRPFVILRIDVSPSESAAVSSQITFESKQVELRDLYYPSGRDIIHRTTVRGTIE